MRRRTARTLDSLVFQTGLVLLLSLAMLAGLSLLALLAASSMLQQQNMAANHADAELARLAAMNAVSAGENLVMSLPDAYRAANCQSDCFVEPESSWLLNPGQIPPRAEFQPDLWWLQWGHTPGSLPVLNVATAGPGQAWTLPGRNPPLFVIQELEFQAAAPPDEEGAPEVAGVGYYQVLGRGTGIGRSSTHVVESILARPWIADTMQDEPAVGNCQLFAGAYDCGRMAYRERR